MVDTGDEGRSLCLLRIFHWIRAGTALSYWVIILNSMQFWLIHGIWPCLQVDENLSPELLKSSEKHPKVPGYSV